MSVLYKKQVKYFVFFLVLLVFNPAPSVLTAVDGSNIVNASFLTNDLVQFWEATIVYKGRNVIAVAGLLYEVYAIVNSLIDKNPSRKIDVIDFYVLYLLWLGFVTAFNSDNTYSLFTLSLCNVGLMFVAAHLIKNDAAIFIKAYEYVLILHLLLNLILILIYPHGITTGSDSFATEYHLLGTKNQTTPLLLLALLIAMIAYELDNNVKLFIGVLGLVTLNVILMGSTTGCVCVAFVLLCRIVFFPHFREKTHERKWSLLAHSQCLIAFVVVVFIGVTFFNIQVLFQDFFSTIFNKDADLNSRSSMIWKLAFEQIVENPFEGYGYGHLVFKHYYAHNGLIELLVISGILGMLLYLSFLMSVFSSIKKQKNLRLKAISYIVLAVIVLANITEAFLFDISILLCLVIIANGSYFDSCISSNEKRLSS